MPDYEKLYHAMFNAMTDAIRHLDVGNVLEARALLIEAQIQAEEQYIETP